MPRRAIALDEITGLVLAGGRGSRMGGVDKGLQTHRGMPMALYTMLRLQPQVGQLMINANRNIPAYEAFGRAVARFPDDNDLVYEQAMVAERAGRHDDMERLLRALYSAVLYVLTPITVYHLIWRGFRYPEYFQRWNERYGPSLSGSHPPCVACWTLKPPPKPLRHQRLKRPMKPPPKR